MNEFVKEAEVFKANSSQVIVGRAVLTILEGPRQASLSGSLIVKLELIKKNLLVNAETILFRYNPQPPYNASKNLFLIFTI